MAKPPKKPPHEIGIEFIKSNFFRVIRADGAFGGLTPTGAVHMGIYSERIPYPTKIVHALVMQDGKQHLGPEKTEKREGRSGVIRELEVGVVMDIAQAMALKAWLDERIDQYQKSFGPLPAAAKAAARKANGQERKKR